MKYIIYIILCFISTFRLYGQQNKYEIGLEISPCITSYYRGNDAIEDNFHLGFLGAINFQYNINRAFSLRTNISYNKSEFEFTNQSVFDPKINGSIEVRQLVRRNFFTIPFLTRASFGNKIKFIIEAGPYLALLKESSMSYTDFTNYGTENSKRIVYGISAGLGTTIPISDRINFDVNIRNYLGSNNTGKYVKQFSTSFILGLNYKFGFKSRFEL